MIGWALKIYYCNRNVINNILSANYGTWLYKLLLYLMLLQDPTIIEDILLY